MLSVGLTSPTYVTILTRVEGNRNTRSLQSQVKATEKQLSSLSDELDDDGGLPLTEILEELDDEGNVICKL